MGFFSQYFINLFLPKVSIEEIRGMQIDSTVRVEGTLQPKETFDVRFNSPVIIESYDVNVGQGVKVGDPIFKVNPAYKATFEKKESEETLNIQIKEIELQKERLIGENHASVLQEIESLKEKISQSEVTLALQKSLLNIGSATEQDVENAQNNLDSLKVSLAIKQNDLIQSKQDNALQIEKLEDQLETLNDKLTNNALENDFYATLQEGVYYSPVEGVILDLSSPNQIIGDNSVVCQIAKVTDASSYEFVGTVEVESVNGLGLGDEIEFDSQLLEGLTGTITSIGNISDNGKIQVKADISRVGYGRSFIGLKMMGEKKTSKKADVPIPRSAILNPENIRQGERIEFYVVAEDQKLLGSEYTLVKGSASVAVIGDRYIGINQFTLDVPSLDRVVVNPSYRLQAGERVTWERD